MSGCKIGPLVLGHCCMQVKGHWLNCMLVSVVAAVAASVGSVGVILPRYEV
jgi:hypothetical protein